MKYFLTLILSIFIIGCGSTSKKTLNNYTNYLKAGQYDKALEVVNSKKFYDDDESKLLKLLEKGTVLFLKERHFQSLQSFDKARVLSNALFTKSISKKAKSAVANENLDNYYGELFERSLIRYYLILNNLKLSKADEITTLEEVEKDKFEEKTKKLTNKDRRRYLQAARAIAAEWYSKSESWKNEKLGDGEFKDDVLGRVVGAIAHEFQGDRNEARVASNLYNDAQKTLFKNYNIFNTFNYKSKSFQENFSDLPNMSRKEVEKNFVDPTDEFKSLKSFLNEQKKTSRKAKKGRLFVTVDSGMINGKSAKKFYFPLGIISRIRTLLRGKESPTDFLFNTLNIDKFNGKPAIAFELPTVSYTPSNEKYFVSVYKGEKLVRKEEMVLVNPLNEFAKSAVDAKSTSTKARLGARLATKYIAAIISAVGSYKAAIANGVPKGIAELTAAGLFIAASKGIELSEKADLRSWRSLPRNIFAQNLLLSPGNYSVKIIRQGDSGSKVISNKPVKLTDYELLNIRSI